MKLKKIALIGCVSLSFCLAGPYSVLAQSGTESQIESINDGFDGLSETETLNALTSEITALQQEIIAQGGTVDATGVTLPNGDQAEQEVERQLVYDEDNTPFARVPKPPRVFNNVGRYK